MKTLSVFPRTCSVDLIPMKVGGKHKAERDTSLRYKAFRASWSRPPFIPQDQPRGRHMGFLSRAPRIQLLHLVASDFIWSNHCHLSYCHRSNFVPLLTSNPPTPCFLYNTNFIVSYVDLCESPPYLARSYFMECPRRCSLT